MSSTLPHLLTHDKNMNLSECEEYIKYNGLFLIHANAFFLYRKCSFISINKGMVCIACMRS